MAAGILATSGIASCAASQKSHEASATDDADSTPDAGERRRATEDIVVGSCDQSEWE
jgi:hypothetical protein